MLEGYEGLVSRETMLADFAAVDRPVEEARGLPNYAYTSEAFARFERDQLLGRTWACIGFGAWVPEPGDLRPVELLGMPLILSRGQDGAIRVFHNVCSHRGLKLVEKAGNVGKVIRCPYHSWAYDLEGRLRATPTIGGPKKNSCPGFDKNAHGLKAVRAASWYDLVFVNLSGSAEPFEDYIRPLDERWSMADPSLLRHGGPDSSIFFELACNWKLALENYCEAYHLPWIHPNLNRYSRLEDHYNIEMEDKASGQGTWVYDPKLSEDGQQFPPFPNWPESWNKRAEYIALYPNVLIGIHNDHFYAVLLEPVSAGCTREHFEIYYVGEEATGSDYAMLREVNRVQWRGIFLEDQGVVEGMQRGRASPGYDGGAFSPAMDGPTHCFHRWAARRLSALLSESRTPYARAVAAAE